MSDVNRANDNPPSRTPRGDAPFRACLLGAPLHGGNRGVRALAASCVKLIRDLRPDARFSIFGGGMESGTVSLRIGGEDVPIRVMNYRLSPRAPFGQQAAVLLAAALAYRLLPLRAARRSILARFETLRLLAEADLIGDIRGGDSFSDIYGMRRFLVGSLPCLIAILMGRSFAMLPQTYGPFGTKLGRAAARFIVRRASVVLARDRTSLEVARELLGAKARTVDPRFCPDVAFALESTPPESADIAPPLPEGDARPLVGLNVNGLLYIGGYTRDNMFGLREDYRRTARLILRGLLDRTDARVLLVPHVMGDHEQSDRFASERLIEELSGGDRERVHLVRDELDQSEIKGIIGRCDFFIGARMHPCIAALSQGEPSAGVAYSRKFAGVFESIGVGDLVLDATTQASEAIAESCLELFARRAELADRLRETLPAVRRELYARFAEDVMAGSRPSLQVAGEGVGAPVSAAPGPIAGGRERAT